MPSKPAPPRTDGRGQPPTDGTVKIMVSLYPKDMELVAWLTSWYGTSRSEAIRTAIRSHVAQVR